MKKSLFIFVTLLIVLNLNAQSKKNGSPDMRYKSNKESSSSTYPASTSNSTKNNGSRPVYSGQSHAASHGGTYAGEQNSQSHKGGTYVNPKSNNNYGIHKTK